MKKTILMLYSLFHVTGAYCQSTEISLNVNSGLFSFSGESAESVSSINYDLREEDGYTNNPYGSKAGLSYGLSASVTRIFKSNSLIGIDLGYELLRSKVNIDRISEFNEAYGNLLRFGLNYLLN